MNLPQPVSRPLDDTRDELVSDYFVAHGGFYVYVKAGFVFDGASIPRFFWRVVGHPFQGLARPASLIHDALYSSHATTREQADSLFYGLLTRNGVTRVKAWTLYRGVRMWGWCAWNDKTPESLSVNKQLVSVAKVLVP